LCLALLSLPLMASAWGPVPALVPGRLLGVPGCLPLGRPVGPRRGGAGPGAAVGAMMMAKGGATSSKKALYVEIEDADQDAWRLEQAIDIIKNGGLGVVPTDSCYSFVTDVQSRKGVERLYGLVRLESAKVKKPLALLCHSISQISSYTTAVNFKKVFKMLKATLPGPYTFIFPSTNELPRVILEHKKHTWKRKEIGVRVPDDPCCLALLRGLDNPVLVYSVPREGKGAMQPFDPALALDRWSSEVDFVVANGPRSEGMSTTVIDMTRGEPELLREGSGSWGDVEELLS